MFALQSNAVLSYRDIPQVRFDPHHRHYAVGILERDYEARHRVDHRTLFLRTAPTLQQAMDELTKELSQFHRKDLQAGCGELCVRDDFIALRPLDRGLEPALRALGIVAEYGQDHFSKDAKILLARHPSGKLFSPIGPDEQLREVTTGIGESILSNSEYVACSCLQSPARLGDQRWFGFKHSFLMDCDVLNYPLRHRLASFNHIGTGPSIETGREILNAQGFEVLHPSGEKPTIRLSQGGLDLFRDHDKVTKRYFYDGTVAHLLQRIIREGDLKVASGVSEALSAALRWEDSILETALSYF